MNCRNPFVNQVGWFTEEISESELKIDEGRNPFVNQVGWFSRENGKKGGRPKKSQSLRKSGRLVPWRS